MPALQKTQAAAAKSDAQQAYADTTYDTTWSAKVGSETISLKYYGPGHTSGDSVVTFQNANIVHMGDLMFYLRNPRVDRGAGASIKNWIVTLESVAKDHPADTIYIAGHSKVNLPLTVTRADLLKFRDYFSGLLAYVQKGIASGRSGGRDREGRERAGIRRLRGQPGGHDSGGLRRAHSEGMRTLGALLVVISIGLSIGAAQVHGQEPRLPAPAATPSESEALIQRARRAVCRGQLPRECGRRGRRSARASPCIASLATRESIRALIAAGDIEPALKGLADLGSAAPADLLLRTADACRAASAFDCATTLYRRARESAGRTAAADEAAIGLARRSSRRARRATRWRPIASFSSPSARRPPSSWPIPGRGASRPDSATPSRSPKPTTTSSSIASPESRHSAAPSTCRPSG